MVKKQNKQTQNRTTISLLNIPLSDMYTKAPTNPSIPKRDVSQSQDTIFYEFDKILPVSIVKYYVIKIQGFNTPNVPFIRTQEHSPTDGIRQRVQIKNLQSGYKYLVKAVGVLLDDKQGKWSIGTAVVVGKFQIQIS